MTGALTAIHPWFTGGQGHLPPLYVLSTSQLLETLQEVGNIHYLFFFLSSVTATHILKIDFVIFTSVCVRACMYAHEYTCLERPKVLAPPTPTGIIGARELPGMGSRKLEAMYMVHWESVVPNLPQATTA